MTFEYEECACTICGETPTRFFGRSTFPLCANASCEQALTDEINLVLTGIEPPPVEPEVTTEEDA